MSKQLTVNEFWNGINVGDYDMQVIMEQTCMTLESFGNAVKGEEFRYKELQDKLIEHFSKHNKILVSIRYGQLSRRIKVLTEKLGYKIEKTTYYDSTASNTDKIYAVLTK